MTTSGVYAVINIYNDKLYVGSSFYIRKRWTEHIRRLNQNIHFNQHLQNSYNKYWISPFIFTMLEYCDKENLIEREQYWMDILKPEYNVRKAEKSQLGIKRSEDFIKRMSQTLRKPKSENHKLNMSLSRKGKKNSEEHIRKRQESIKKNKDKILDSVTNVIIV